MAGSTEAGFGLNGQGLMYGGGRRIPPLDEQHPESGNNSLVAAPGISLNAEAFRELRRSYDPAAEEKGAQTGLFSSSVIVGFAITEVLEEVNQLTVGEKALFDQDYAKRSWGSGSVDAVALLFLLRQLDLRGAQ